MGNILGNVYLVQLRVRGRHVFMGYLNQPEKTSDAFDKDGWFKTGDKARRDGNGFLYVVGKDSGMHVDVWYITCTCISDTRLATQALV